MLRTLSVAGANPSLQAAALQAALLQNASRPTAPEPVVPVVYQFEMQQTEGIFMAQAFAMRDRDLVYVANADTVQLLSIFASVKNGGTGVSQ